MRHPELPETGQWVEKLERWDPQNALFHLITAESIEQAHFRRRVMVAAGTEERTASVAERHGGSVPVSEIR